MTITVISERETLLESEITELKAERAELEHKLQLLQLDSDLIRTGAGLVNQKLCREINKLEKKNAAFKAELAKPEQEPVAWRYDLVTCNDDLVKNCFTMDYSETTECHNVRPLYAAPVDCKCNRPMGHLGTASGEYVEQNCNRHPDAPHGLDDVSSYYAGYYVCLCQSWSPGEASGK